MGFTKMLLSLVRFDITFMTPPQSLVKTARKNAQTIRADTFCFYEIRQTLSNRRQKTHGFFAARFTFILHNIARFHRAAKDFPFHKVPLFF
jgi:hypothetical protein